MPAFIILVFNLSPARKQKRTSLVAHALVKISTQLGFPLPTAAITLLEEIRLYRIARPESLFNDFLFQSTEEYTDRTSQGKYHGVFDIFC